MKNKNNVDFHSSISEYILVDPIITTPSAVEKDASVSYAFMHNKIYNNDNNLLAITCGLPLSGKSTWAKQSNRVIVCPDLIRLALHGQQYEPLAEPLVWSITEIMARSLLKAGHKIIIDATNTTEKRRIMWVKMAKEFETKLTIYWLNVSMEECLWRNEKIGYRIDPNIIYRMAMQFERPSSKEGKVVKIFKLS